MDISIKKGLDIPIASKPRGQIQSLKTPQQVALSLDSFEHIRFKVHIRVGDKVQIGQPLAENKAIPGQMFVSPGAGVIKEIARGVKRRLVAIVVELDENEKHFEPTPLKISTASYDDIVAKLMQSGIFPHIRMRPFCLLANPKLKPKAIFVHALESAPFRPSAEMQVEKNEEFFQLGLDTLAKLTSGSLHLVYQKETHCVAFTGATNCEKHGASGPHPIANPSLHIQKMAPIKTPEDVIWTLSTLDVIAVGKIMATGQYQTSRIMSIAGSGILEEKRGFFSGRMGYPIADLMAGRITNELLRYISGDPLTGEGVLPSEFLGFYHDTFTALPENTQREALHFFRLGLKKYSATKAYLSGHRRPSKKGYFFTTNQHGEERPFIDGAIYNKVMPLRIPTMHLIKAVLAEDFELAQTLGLLEVAPEDFALPSFICPSKIEMIDIIKRGLHLYSKEMGH